MPGGSPQDVAPPPTPWLALLFRVALTWVAHLTMVTLVIVSVHAVAGSFFDAIDDWILRRMYLAYSARAVEVAEAISLLGRPEVIVPLMLCGVAIVFFRASPREGLFVFCVYFFAGASYLALNPLLARARPHLFPELPEPTGYSTPSGHSIATMALFGSIAVIAWRRRGTRGLWIAIPATLVFVAVGLTRPYLQVHYPTDVLVAWLITGTWMVLVDRILRPRE